MGRPQPLRRDSVGVGIAASVVLDVILLVGILAIPCSEYWQQHEGGVDPAHVARMVGLLAIGVIQLPIMIPAIIVAFVKHWRNLAAGLVIGTSLAFLLGPAACFGSVGSGLVKLYPPIQSSYPTIAVPPLTPMPER